MQIFLDTAEISEIEARAARIDGVTTNPSLIAKSGAGVMERIKEITKAVSGPVSAEVVATDRDGMLEEGKKLAPVSTILPAGGRSNGRSDQALGS